VFREPTGARRPCCRGSEHARVPGVKAPGCVAHSSHPKGNRTAQVASRCHLPPFRPDWIPLIGGCWIFGLGWGASWGCNMLRDGTVISDVDGISGAFGTAPAVSFAHVRQAFRLFAIVVGAASLAACAQSSVVSERSQALASRSASIEPARTTASPARTRVAVARTHTPYASRKKAGDTRIASQGIASFYSEVQQTASGEKFDGRDLTAAHPTLPFGTRLRVTDVKTGRSVTVRVNDRGPYVPGRVVDVSYSAAQSLGMVGKGVANVRLDVVR